MLASISPKSSAHDLISGSASIGTPSVSHVAASHVKSSNRISIVRDAFETSVMCAFPPVSLYTNQLSIVPKHKSFSRAASRTPSSFSNNHRIFIALKYVLTGNPHVATNAFLSPSHASLTTASHVSRVRESNHTTAFASAVPSLRRHAHVVSR